MNKPDRYLIDLFFSLKEKLGLSLQIEDYELLVEAFEAGFRPQTHMELQRLCCMLWVKSPSQAQKFAAHFDQYFSKLFYEAYRQYLTIQASDSLTSGILQSESPSSSPSLPLSPSTDVSPFSSPPSSVSTNSPSSKRIPSTIDRYETQVVQAVTQASCVSERVPLGQYDLNDEYFPIKRRELRHGWRRLSQREEFGESALWYIPGIIQQISQYGGFFRPVYLPLHQPQTELVLLIDCSNSMIPFGLMAERLITTASQALLQGNFRQLGIYYFRNAPSEKLFLDKDLLCPVFLSDLRTQLSEHHTIAIVFSDAGAARRSKNVVRRQLTTQFLTSFTPQIRHIAWLNPLSQERWRGSTAESIAQYLPMFSLELSDWRNLLKELRGQGQVGWQQHRSLVQLALRHQNDTAFEQLQCSLEALATCSSDPNRFETAIEQIIYWSTQGDQALELLVHASFPLALTPDLLYYLRENFVQDSAWLLCGDLLLSKLCRTVGYQLYEIDPLVRHLMLKWLAAQEGYGQDRLRQLSDSMLFYMHHRLEGRQGLCQDFGEHPAWIALAYTQPNQLAYEIALSLRSSLSEDTSSHRIRIASWAATLAEPLEEAGFQSLLLLARAEGRLARGDEQGAQSLLDRLPGELTQIEVDDIVVPIPGRPLDQGFVCTDELLILISAPLLAESGSPVAALEIQREIDGIVDALTDVPNHLALKVTVKIATLTTLQKVFSDKNRPLIIHFIGHGMVKDQSYALLLEDEYGIARPYDCQSLRPLLNSLAEPPCQLAVLSACHSEGIAQEFLNAGVPHVIGINASDQVLDLASRTFSSLFYYTLWNQEPIQRAYDQGRIAVERSTALQQQFDPSTLKRANRSESPKFRLLPETSDHQSPLAITARSRGDIEGPSWESTNLSVVNSNFIGRRREIHELVKLLSEYNLVILHGLGGMGKTFLADAVGRWYHERQRWRDGVWKVELRNVDSVPSALSRLQWSLLEVIGWFETPSLETLFNGLKHKHCLILLDDLDTLRTKDAEGTQALLATLGRCRRVKILVTTRRDLPSDVLATGYNYEIPGMTQADVSSAFSLYAPTLEQGQFPEQVGRDFVALLDFFDGYPLPIKLAAVYMKENRCSFQELCKALNIDPLPTLRPVPAPETRKNSLWAALELSYKTLPPGSQEFFPHLATFPSGLSTEMAEWLWGDKAVPALRSLLQYSMAELVHNSDGQRFQLPEPARYYAEIKLVQGMEEIAPRVLAYFYDYAQSVHEQLSFDPRSQATQQRLQAEQSNLQKFLEWGYTAESSSTSICYSARITALLGQWWQWVLPSADPLDSLSQAQTRAEMLGDVMAQADVLKLSGDLTRVKSDLASAADFYDRALVFYVAQYADTDDLPAQASIQAKIGEIHWQCQDFEQALVAYRTALTRYETAEKPLACANVLICLGQIYEAQEKPSLALERYQHAHELYVSEQYQPGITQSNRLINCLRRGHNVAGGVEYFTEFITAEVSLELVSIPEGSFLMGSPATEKERLSWEGPQHEVHVPAFYLGAYPVTQAQWHAVMGNNPSNFQGDNRPVESVSWHGATEFCERLTQQTGNEYRLASESEWEYACRAGTTTPYCFGQTLTSEQAHFNAAWTTGTREVGQFPSNAFGLYDMHGNIHEWCQDHWNYNYDGAPTDGSAWQRENDNHSTKVSRGGSWANNPGYCRSAYRNYNDPDNAYINLGFRVAFSAPRT